MTTRSFARDDITTVADAVATVAEFKAFLVDRFAAYTRYTEVTDARGRVVPAVEDPARTSGGWGHWEVVRTWLDEVTDDSDDATVGFRHYLADDRGPGMWGPEVRVPLAWVFGEIEHDAAYAEYLRLKARFEPANGEPEEASS